jgi:hypothetical protein
MKSATPCYFRVLAITAVLAVSSLFLSTASAFDDFVGQAIKVTGDVHITRAGANLPVSSGTALELGDVIQTGPGARLRVRFIDGSIMSFAQTTTLSIDIFSVDAANKSRSVVLTMLQGIVDTAAAKSGESKFDYQIRTGSAYSAVRGTEWLVAAQPGSTSVAVISGTVEVGANSSNSKPALVNRGNWVTVGLQTGVGAVQPTPLSVLQPLLDATGDTAMLQTPAPAAPSYSAPSQSAPAAPSPATPSYVPPPVFVPDYSRTDGSGNNGHHVNGGGGYGDHDHGSSSN